MATLNTTQLAELRQKLAASQSTVSWNKTQINAALQALEDWYEGEKTTVSGLINTATSPVVLTAGQKKLLGAYFLMQKALRELI